MAHRSMQFNFKGNRLVICIFSSDKTLSGSGACLCSSLSFVAPDLTVSVGVLSTESKMLLLSGIYTGTL